MGWNQNIQLLEKVERRPSVLACHNVDIEGWVEEDEPIANSTTPLIGGGSRGRHPPLSLLNRASSKPHLHYSCLSLLLHLEAYIATSHFTFTTKTIEGISLYLSLSPLPHSLPSVNKTYLKTHFHCHYLSFLSRLTLLLIASLATKNVYVFCCI